MFTGVKAVLFDLGGTLVEYAVPSWPAALGQCVDAVYGFLIRPEEERFPPAASVPPPDEAHARRGPARPDTPLPHRITMALRRMVRGASGRTLPAIAEACARPLMATGRICEDTLPVLEVLRARGYRLGLVSNTPWGTPDYLWEKQIEKFGLTPLLDVRLFSSGVGFRKPDPRIFREALGQLGVAAGRAVFVGDSPRDDIAGAHGAGLRTVLIARRPCFPDAVDPPPDASIQTLADLPALLPSGIQNC